MPPGTRAAPPASHHQSDAPPDAAYTASHARDQPPSSPHPARTAPPLRRKAATPTHRRTEEFESCPTSSTVMFKDQRNPRGRRLPGEINLPPAPMSLYGMRL